MASDSLDFDLPPSYEEVMLETVEEDVVQPTTLFLDGESIVESADSPPLYQTSLKLENVSFKDTSLLFQRFNQSRLEKGSSEQPNQPLFYLVHPKNARYREDTHEYFITAKSTGMLGNVILEASRSKLQKTEFRAFSSTGKTARDDPLFDPKEAQNLLFSVKPVWAGNRFRWTDSNSNEIALEDYRNDRHSLSITSPISRQMRDALVALWMLRLWHDIAESRKARREELEALTPANDYPGVSKAAKRVGVLGVFAGVASV